ncbi:cobalt ABC transporter [Luteococcus sanguinis]|uniref:Cobalt ABC transporter n=1 Tax=Luteococcus sanguinis TaxID=174038 RepID=A0ABW1WZD0_9ACTN
MSHRRLTHPPLRILVDGGSGAGKTTFAAQLAERLGRGPVGPVQVVHLEDFYPGWHGLAEASRIVCDQVLRDVRPGFPRWDWTTSRVREWVELDPSRPMVIEGCGAITPASHRLADWSIWLDLDATTRKRVALARDQGGFDAWWDVWAAQEQAHWRRDRPQELADVVFRRRSTSVPQAAAVRA